MIKTYEDACKVLGVEPVSRLFTEDKNGNKEEVTDIAHIAYIKLCTIARALNNDPDFPRFTKDECRYMPWFYLYNQKEIDEMDEKDRNRLVRWDASGDANCGLVCAHSNATWAVLVSYLGSRLVVKSSKIAIYFGKQFKELWKDFLIGKQ